MSENQGVHEENEMKIDTSRMNQEKIAALEVTEQSRQGKWENPSFASGLFMGNFHPEMISPFPEQSESEKKIADAILAELIPFLEKNLDPDLVDKTGEIPKSIYEGFTKMNLWAMKIPKEYGGLGLSQFNYNRIMSCVASYCGSTAVLLSAHQSIGVPQPLKLFGTKEQKEKYLPRFAKGAISAFALTEPDVGSDPARMGTTATPIENGDYYLINGQKLWITNGPIADILIVMAKTPPKIKNGREIPQITAFIVEKNTPGFTVKHVCEFMGIRAIKNGLLEFKDVKVPKENILVGLGKGLKLAFVTLNSGRLTLPAAAVGMGKQCLNIIRYWANKRKQWGNAIGKHEAVSVKIANIQSKTFAMEAITNLTSAMVDKGGADIRIEAAMAKMFCSETAWEIVDETLQIRGGRGYETATSLKGRGELGLPVERMLRDCRINRIIEGTTDIMHLFLAREALDPHMAVAGELLLKHTPLSEKLKTGVKMANFYLKWYPTQWINTSAFTSYQDYPDGLASHMSFIDKTSHHLARSIFHSMGMYQNSLERRQYILSKYVDIGTELFVMAATCSYAKSKLEKNPHDKTPYYLAHFFCKEARRRIENFFKAISENDVSHANKLAKGFLKGEYTWMEEGIIPAVKPKDFVGLDQG